MNELQHNMRVFTEALRLAGALSVTLYYRGNCETLTMTHSEKEWPKQAAPFMSDDDEALGSVTYYKKDSATGKFNSVTEPVMDALGHLVKQLTDEKLGSDWYEDNGGSGNVEIFADGYACVAYYPRVEGEIADDTQITQDDPLWPNIQQVIDALGTVGAAKVFVSYSGSGDSGSFDMVDFEGPDGADFSRTRMPDVTLEVPCVDYSVMPNVHSIEKQTTNFDTAVKDLCDRVLYSAGHGSYENEDGGNGLFTISVDGSALLEHVDYGLEDGDLELTFYGDNIPATFRYGGELYAVHGDDNTPATLVPPAPEESSIENDASPSP